MNRVVIAHPSADVYGSDLQLVESVKAFQGAGWDVRLVVPQEGPLRAHIPPGASVSTMPFSPLQKRHLRPIALLRFAASLLADVVRIIRALRSARPDLVYVNTVTIPTWSLAARLLGIPVLVHVHEAESDVNRMLRQALVRPLGLAQAIVVNSASAGEFVTAEAPTLRPRMEVIHNGVPDLGEQPAHDALPGRILFVGRLSPRKGVDTLLEAVARVRSGGLDVTIDVCGSVFPGYEDYETQLHDRAAQPDLAGAVRFLGYVRPVTDALRACSVLAVPSRTEPFGNVAVEGLLAGRPVIASRVQGLAEIIDADRTGLLVEAEDADAWADAITTLVRDPDLARRLASAGRADALARFSTESYASSIVRAAGHVARAREVPRA